MSSISIVVAGYVIYKVGGGDIFLMTRSSRGIVLSQYTKILFFKEFFASVFAVSLILYFEKSKKKYITIAAVSLICGGLYSILTISRGGLVQFIFPLLFLLSFYGKIKVRTAFVVVMAGFLISILWKAVLTNLIFNGVLSVDLVSVEYPAEFYEWMKIVSNTKDDDLLLGRSYLEGILSLIYPFYKVEPLSVWYVYK